MSYKEEIEKLLEECGYTLECFSPLEISNEIGDRATGEFAQFIIESLRDSKKEASC